MGVEPKRRWLMVRPPDFLESYSKYAWANMSVWSPMILMEFLLAPTVPSEPRPQNLQAVVPAGAVLGLSSGVRDRKVTSSSMPMVKHFLGASATAFL